jgi:hypothetical protein
MRSGFESAPMIDTPSNPALPSRQGKAWSTEEDRRLYDAFVTGPPVDSLASVHERSVGGIRSRLVRLGLLDMDGQVVEPVPPFVAVTRRRAATPEASTSVEKPGTVRSIFAVTTDDGWAVEIRSNRPLGRLLVERLMAMLNGVVSQEDTEA